MTPSRLASVVATLALLSSPLTALAHEHRTYQIGDKQYLIEIGSINEPASIDDKSGVELTVQEIQPSPAHQEPLADGGGDEHEGTPVAGLESTLKVEVSAGDQKKTFDLRATWGEEGSYEAVFYPTVQTSYTYRLTGTINNVPVDLSFTCKPAETDTAADDNTATKISEQVTQLSKAGAYGCFASRAGLNFPAQGASVAELTSHVEAMQSQKTMNTVALALGALGTALGLGALAKGRKGSSMQ